MRPQNSEHKRQIPEPLPSRPLSPPKRVLVAGLDKPDVQVIELRFLESTCFCIDALHLALKCPWPLGCWELAVAGAEGAVLLCEVFEECFVCCVWGRRGWGGGWGLSLQ